MGARLLTGGAIKRYVGLLSSRHSQHGVGSASHGPAAGDRTATSAAPDRGSQPVGRGAPLQRFRARWRTTTALPRAERLNRRGRAGAGCATAVSGAESLGKTRARVADSPCVGRGPAVARHLLMSERSCEAVGCGPHALLLTRRGDAPGFRSRVPPATTLLVAGFFQSRRPPPALLARRRGRSRPFRSWLLAWLSVFLRFSAFLRLLSSSVRVGAATPDAGRRALFVVRARRVRTSAGGPPGSRRRQHRRRTVESFARRGQRASTGSGNTKSASASA